MTDAASLEIPLEVETRRLVLRCPQAGDGAIVHASVVESLADLRRYAASLPWSLEEPSVEASERYCRESHRKYLAREEFAFLAFEKAGGAHVGSCGIHDIDWKAAKCEIGWFGRSSMLGRGFMTEAAGALLGFAFERLQMRRVAALPEAGNPRSCALCERIGLQLEGTLRGFRVSPAGERLDVRIYAAVR